MKKLYKLEHLLACAGMLFLLGGCSDPMEDLEPKAEASLLYDAEYVTLKSSTGQNAEMVTMGTPPSKRKGSTGQDDEIILMGTPPSKRKGSTGQDDEIILMGTPPSKRKGSTGQDDEIILMGTPPSKRKGSTGQDDEIILMGTPPSKRKGSTGQDDEIILMVYMVVSKNMTPSALEAKVAAAGGKIVQVMSESGVVVVQSSKPGFVNNMSSVGRIELVVEQK